MSAKHFLTEDFLLKSAFAKKLYHGYAAKMPIIDYHCHLPQKEIANDTIFGNVTQVWLNGDHYKWRAMRTNGVDENFITGTASAEDKFRKWAQTVPHTLRNPLYHWTHMEMLKPFGINCLLNPDTSSQVYHEFNEKLATKDFSVRALLQKADVRLVCTTDDPCDDLAHHQQLAKDATNKTKVLPTFRPDKAMAADNVEALAGYIKELGKVVGKDLSTFESYLEALESRHTYFHNNGCRLSDHGLENIYVSDTATAESVGKIYIKALSKDLLNVAEVNDFKAFMLVYFAQLDNKRGWVQQFHLGALRNNNSRMLRTLGPDTGFDSIGDFSIARPLATFLDKLDADNCLPKTIIYNLNPSDNALIGTMIGNFNDGSVAGKVQFGSAWWFLDQKDGMEQQMNALSNFGLLSRFIGMLTDSRSFLSYSRHEYFRRILCNLLATDVVNGELPEDEVLLGSMVENICFHNANNYFDFNLQA